MPTEDVNILARFASFINVCSRFRYTARVIILQRTHAKAAPDFLHICRVRLTMIAYLIFLSGLARGQEFVPDSSIMQMVERHRELNASKMSMPGYRIQLYFGSDRNSAQAIRSEFISTFPDVPCYLLFQQPYFKVRIGDFRTRQEASGFRKRIAGIFTSAFIVPDDVKLPAD